MSMANTTTTLLSRPTFNLIVASTARTFGIGSSNDLPWKRLCPSDLAHFKAQTTRRSTNAKADTCNAVIMGRKTWDSLPSKFRPLPNRLNIVITRQLDWKSTSASSNDDQKVLVAHSLSAALDLTSDRAIDQIYIMGGGSIYAEALASSDCTTIYRTLVTVPEDMEAACDVFCPISLQDYTVTQTSAPIVENGLTLVFETLTRTTTTKEMTTPAPLPAHEELQYLELLERIMTTGVSRPDRTGVGTRSLFGASMRFNLRGHAMPLLTTKRTFWRGVVEELRWLLSGDTNANTLAAANVHIWDANGSRAFLDAGGHTTREVGDLGPVYGFQWRHFGAKYTTMHADYTGQGVDQLAQVIHLIKTNPTSRRIILSAWNPSDLEEMALPPCHMFCQFYVANGELSCQLYQRSADMGLGVPFNIASYALLTHLLAHVTGLMAGEFVHTIGDAHVYQNHVTALQEQIKREPRPFPTLTIDPSVTSIDGWQASQLSLTGYKPHPSIKMDMAV